MSTRITPRLYNGTRDFLPAEMLAREELLATMRRSFQLYGFAPVETPAMEYLEILLGKYGEDEKLIYKLDYRNDEAARRLALRYDHTVPLARLIGMHSDLPLPFKRYQFQPVWRADRPQPRQGRFREFWQCDIDTVGSESRLADAEILAAAAEMLTALELPDYRIRVNHRRLLTTLIRWAGYPVQREGAVCGAIDKLEKIGREGVLKELAGLPAEGGDGEKLLDLLDRGADWSTLERLSELDSGDGAAETALAELEELHRLCLGLGVPEEHLRLDLHLARGLSYYTGPIFETVIPSLPHMGSVMGGGRYDELIGLYLGRSMPATGLTMGLDRILAAMAQLGREHTRTTPAVVWITRGFAETDEAAVALAGRLRGAGIPCELSLEQGKLKKQFSAANRKGIPLVITLGPDEAAAGKVTLKDMQSGSQESLDEAGLLERLQAAL